MIWLSNSFWTYIWTSKSYIFLVWSNKSQQNTETAEQGKASIGNDPDDGLKRSTTANSLLGLTVALHGSKREYNNWPVWNLAKNNYYGFKVLQM